MKKTKQMLEDEMVALEVKYTYMHKELSNKVKTALESSINLNLRLQEVNALALHYEKTILVLSERLMEARQPLSSNASMG
jgi:hypothetical protein